MSEVHIVKIVQRGNNIVLWPFKNKASARMFADAINDRTGPMCNAEVVCNRTLIEWSAGHPLGVQWIEDLVSCEVDRIYKKK